MKTIFDHIEHVKGKPHHVRRRVAFTAAAGVAASVALVWLLGNLATGTFAIQGSNFAASVGAESPVVKTSDTGTQGLAGAAAAAVQDVSAPAHIEIVDTTPTPVVTKQPDRTILPF
jgi:hypothetical protein